MFFHSITPIVSIFAFVLLTVGTTAAQTTELDQLSGEQIQQLATSMGVQSSEVKVLLAREQSLWREFLSLNEQTDAQVQFLKNVVRSLDSTSGAASTQEVLPESFQKAIARTSSDVESPGVKMFKAGFMGLPVEKLPEQHVLATAVRQLTANRPEVLLPLLQERSERQPGAVDYIIYLSIRDGLAENTDLQQAGSDAEPRKVLSRAQGVLSLTNAKNPVYRLLSVELAPVVEADQSKLIAVNSEFINDSDPTIRVAAASALSNIETPEARAAIESFLKQAKQNGSQKLESDFQAILDRSKQQTD